MVFLIVISSSIFPTQLTKWGCLRVYPASHRLGRLAESSGQPISEKSVLDDYPLSESKAVEAEPGDVVFFRILTLHGSMSNRSQHVRKTVLAQLHREDDNVEEGNTHPNARLVLSGWNFAAKRSLGAQSS
jgi:phytanoyl-CoA hydroxylase